MDNEHLGYLANDSSWLHDGVAIVGIETAYLYNWVPVEGGLRLDQQTDGGDRSLTYSSNGDYPCWGLGANWVVVTHGEDESISFVERGVRYFLARNKFSSGRWSLGVVWSPERGFETGTFQKLKFRSVN
ncbi:hypothetical protein LP420_35015 [Massilia sp. B-10]|nr:hypothetical protein LP420_35015 [Massilia sp. B-10]